MLEIPLLSLQLLITLQRLLHSFESFILLLLTLIPELCLRSEHGGKELPVFLNLLDLLGQILVILFGLFDLWEDFVLKTLELVSLNV